MLDLVIHSLYTDKEIFVRELISNAADATEKMKFLQTSGAEIFGPDAALTISVATDDQAKTITFTDAGLGMTHGELIDNLGTIAHSGSKAFLEQLKASKDRGGGDKRERWAGEKTRSSSGSLVSGFMRRDEGAGQRDEVLFEPL